MELTDEIARLERRMEELQAETDRLTLELERLGRELADGSNETPEPREGTASKRGPTQE